jgi:transposase
MSQINRRKPYKYKENKVVKVPKTSRKEMTPIQRAFIAGAVLASRDGYASARALSKRMKQTQPGISAVVRRVEKRAEEGGFDLWDSILYENDLGRGRSALLSQEQKDSIIKIVTSSRNNREKESWQAISDGDFSGIVPKMSISTFENVLYEAGYSRKRPGWKPSLTKDQIETRYLWALEHNPDRYEVGDGLGFDFRIVCFTDETPARIGEERGMQRVWCKDGERYDEGVKKTRNRKDCALQFYGAFRYDHKGPCHVYWHETDEEKEYAVAALEAENLYRQHYDDLLQTKARTVLSEANESDVNGRYYTRKKQYVPSKHDYKRGDRTRGGVDGYRHREGALKKVTPWINSLKKQGITCVLLQDGAPSHKASIARDYLTVERVETMLWPGHSPEVNASEHAWPWIRRHVTRDFTPSCNEKQCEEQWVKEWEAIPQEVINRWVMYVPVMVRRIIKHGGNNDFHG